MIRQNEQLLRDTAEAALTANRVAEARALFTGWKACAR